jgi:putative transposase
MKVGRGHVIHLQPTEEQKQALARACGVARFTYNWVLSEYQKELQTYHASGKTIKPAKISELKKRWNSVKETIAPWVYDSPKDANQQPFMNFQKALSRFFEDRKKSGGRKSAFPSFKKKGAKESFYCSNDKVAVESDRIRIPVVGWVKTSEKFKPISEMDLKILSVVVSKKHGEWFASVSYTCDVEVLPQEDDRPIIAIDLGLRTFATTLNSDGVLEEIQAPQPLKHALKKLKKLQQRAARCPCSPSRKKNKRHQNKRKAWKKEVRKANRQKVLENRRLRKLSETNPGIEVPRMTSSRYEKLQDKIRRQHARVVNVRKDFLHKLTTRLCRENQAVIIEDLSVTGMISNKKWARKVGDLGLRTFRTMLEYKHELTQTDLLILDRWFPSSKTCSCCGEKNISLKFEKQWVCTHCGTEHDRDVNAVSNMLDLYSSLGFPWLRGSLIPFGSKTDVERAVSTAPAEVCTGSPVSSANNGASKQAHGSESDKCVEIRT